jgi:hypothetical protein
MDSVLIETKIFKELPEGTYMLTNGANEILSSAGGGSNQGIRDLDIGAFTHYDVRNKSGDIPLTNTALDLSRFSVLFDSEDVTLTYCEPMKKVMIPIISKTDKVEPTKYSSPTGQVMTPKIIGTTKNIGKKTLYAGSVVKVMSAPTNSEKFKGVYHIKGIDYNKNLDQTPYPGIENDNVVQGYRLFIDYYIAIIKDFIRNTDANTLYLVQIPGDNFAGRGKQFYGFLLYNIYYLYLMNNKHF